MLVARHEFDSGKAGTHLIVFGGIHGNETCGPTALRKVIQDIESGSLKLLSGRCTFFPICNPRAFERGVRYTEENLNRVFRPRSKPTTYEQELANEICPHLQSADALLDLHSMQSQGVPFVFLNSVTPESMALCEALDTGVILRGWPEVYASRKDLLSCCTQTFSDLHQKPNALIECGKHGDPAADEVAYRAVRRALIHFGICDGDLISSTDQNRNICMTKVYTRESPSDRFLKTWENFEEYKEGEILAIRSNGQEIHAKENGVMILPSPISDVGTEWFYTGRVLF